jgi:hypothetical protein
MIRSKLSTKVALLSTLHEPGMVELALEKLEHDAKTPGAQP